MLLKNIEADTRKLFTKIHPEQMKNKNNFFRLRKLLSCKFFGVNKYFFKNKICLDAASGLNLNATFNLLDLGAKYVYACDMNSKINKIYGKKFSKYNNRYEVNVANLKKLPYKNQSFDFVHCAGAIHHTTNYKKSIKELCRVVKRGGYIYIEFYGSGGIIRELTTFMREKFKKDKKFATIIENLNEKKLRNFFYYILEKKNKKKIDKLIDGDLILTIKDRLMSPIYKEFSSKEIIPILNKNGFYNIKRLKRVPIMYNLRKYLIKIYYNYNTAYAKFLYGSGMPCIFAKKK